MLRTELYADPQGKFVHQLILQSCCRFAKNTALVDSSCKRRFSYAEYGELIESLARGFVAAGLRPGEVVAIYLYNSWEFCATYHAVTLAGGVPTPLNPSYRQREVRYQMENSGAVFLVTDGPNLKVIEFSGNSRLRRLWRRFPTRAGPLACRKASCSRITTWWRMFISCWGRTLWSFFPMKSCFASCPCITSMD
jgi:non-ribosomal peptide synthetase component E (peptide arylation enzyme)